MLQLLRELIASLDGVPGDAASTCVAQLRRLAALLESSRLGVDVLIHDSVGEADRRALGDWLTGQPDVLRSETRIEVQRNGVVCEISMTVGVVRPPRWHQLAEAPVLLVMYGADQDEAWFTHLAEEAAGRPVVICTGPGAARTPPPVAAATIVPWPLDQPCPLFVRADAQRWLETVVAGVAIRLIQALKDAGDADRVALTALQQDLQAAGELSVGTLDTINATRQRLQLALDRWRDTWTQNLKSLIDQAFDTNDRSGRLVTTVVALEDRLTTLQFKPHSASQELARVPETFIVEAEREVNAVVEQRLQEIETEVQQSYDATTSELGRLGDKVGVRLTWPVMALHERRSSRRSGMTIPGKFEALILKPTSGFFSQWKARIGSLVALIGIAQIITGGGVTRTEAVKALRGWPGWALAFAVLGWTIYEARRLRREREGDVMREARAWLRSGVETSSRKVAGDTRADLQNEIDRVVAAARVELTIRLDARKASEDHRAAAIRQRSAAAAAPSTMRPPDLAGWQRRLGDQQARPGQAPGVAKGVL